MAWGGALGSGRSGVLALAGRPGFPAVCARLRSGADADNGRFGFSLCVKFPPLRHAASRRPSHVRPGRRLGPASGPRDQ